MFIVSHPHKLYLSNYILHSKEILLVQRESLIFMINSHENQLVVRHCVRCFLNVIICRQFYCSLSFMLSFRWVPAPTDMNHQVMYLRHLNSDFVSFQDSRFCISNKFPDDPHAASAKIMLWQQERVSFTDFCLRLPMCFSFQLLIPLGVWQSVLSGLFHYFLVSLLLKFNTHIKKYPHTFSSIVYFSANCAIQFQWKGCSVKNSHPCKKYSLSVYRSIFSRGKISWDQTN